MTKVKISLWIYLSLKDKKSGAFNISVDTYLLPQKLGPGLIISISVRLMDSQLHQNALVN